MKNALAALTSVMLLDTLLADERRLALAFARWQRQPGIIPALHVATSGWLLTGDIAELG